MAAIDELKTLLSEDLRQLEGLADLLLREKQALSSPDISPLQELTNEKNQILGAIRDRARQKIHLLVSMGYRPESGEPSRFIRAGGMDELYQLWKAADQKLRECQTLNQNNGRVLSHLQKRLARVTDIFRGASSQQKLYGAQGQQTTVSSGTVFASA
ncbi:flagellar protein FlgN [Marinobacter sp.]|uniref:flagella synthesis protein FlgN n=1 Tax=Marinobacter sp. TaxID=50741 RepID=UPI002B2762B4|nr:flagellar protein FlgN [Marinobacter sp.]